MVALHRGEIGAALRHVAADPESFKPWHDAAWRPWYTAVWAEAGVLAALPDRREPSRPGEVRRPSRTPSPSAIVERAAAIDAGDTEALITWPPRWTPPAAATSAPAPWSSPAATHARRASAIGRDRCGPHGGARLITVVGGSRPCPCAAAARIQAGRSRSRPLRRAWPSPGGTGFCPLAYEPGCPPGEAVAPMLDAPGTDLASISARLSGRSDARAWSPRWT